ncbi:hypothetical protein M5K25_005928 [Dendrobium thyrsiflorum]|uniref:Uncharacterized protein n=1 Tax=Dendrobium thyrsiflorum TaxID=117978 RepID=A0ABD0VH98_DENTH
MEDDVHNNARNRRDCQQQEMIKSMVSSAMQLISQLWGENGGKPDQDPMVPSSQNFRKNFGSLPRSPPHRWRNRDGICRISSYPDLSDEAEQQKGVEGVKLNGNRGAEETARVISASCEVTKPNSDGGPKNDLCNLFASYEGKESDNNKEPEKRCVRSLHRLRSNEAEQRQGSRRSDRAISTPPVEQRSRTTTTQREDERQTLDASLRSNEVEQQRRNRRSDSCDLCASSELKSDSNKGSEEAVGVVSSPLQSNETEL